MTVIDYQATLEAKIIFELQELARLDERREVALSRLDKYRRALRAERYDHDPRYNEPVQDRAAAEHILETFGPESGLEKREPPEFPAYIGWDGREHAEY